MVSARASSLTSWHWGARAWLAPPARGDLLFYSIDNGGDGSVSGGAYIYELAKMVQIQPNLWLCGMKDLAQLAVILDGFLINLVMVGTHYYQYFAPK